MSITELVESPAYKKVMGKVYGIGAAVVILGALWKILHLPGAAAMLIAGLGTEAIIFFLSAFEPPHEMPDWSLVYPELVGLEPKAASHGGGNGGGSELQALIQTGNLDQKTVDKLSDGIKKLSETSSQLADLGDASLATQSYLQNIQQASESVGKLGNVQAKTAQAIEESASALTQSYSLAASVITESGTKIANQLTKSSEGFAQSISEKGNEYQQQLASLNSNLASINSIYELQLKGSKAQIEATEQLTEGIGQMKSHLNQTVEDAKVYKEQIAELSKTVGELNSIYGNMLSAMNR